MSASPGELIAFDHVKNAHTKQNSFVGLFVGRSEERARRGSCSLIFAIDPVSCGCDPLISTHTTSRDVVFKLGGRPC